MVIQGPQTRINNNGSLENVTVNIESLESVSVKFYDEEPVNIESSELKKSDDIVYVGKTAPGSTSCGASFSSTHNQNTISNIFCAVQNFIFPKAMAISCTVDCTATYTNTYEYTIN